MRDAESQRSAQDPVRPLVYEPHVRDVIKSRSLLADRGFRSLWLSQGLAQTAQNALLFTLIVVVVNVTGETLATSILVLCFILPSIPMGFIVGVVLDRTSKESVLVTTSLLRAAGCVLFLLFHNEVWAIYVIAVCHATAGLFFNPAVVSLIPSLVSRERLVSANSLYNFTITASQLVGIVFLAPIMLKTLGEDAIFILTAFMFLASAALATQVRAPQEEPAPRPEQRAVFGGVIADFRDSWRILFSDRYSTVALLQLITSGTLVLLFAILIPRYMQDVIGAPPENAAFVFAPAGIGAIVGLRFLPWFAKFGKDRVVIVGLVGLVISLVLLALVEPLAEITEQAPGSDWVTRQLQLSLLQALTMLIAGPMGFFYALLNAPAQTVLHERAPPEMRGRIFATQVVSANFISLLPLLVLGALTDVVKVPAVLLMIAAAVAGLAVASVLVARNEGQDGEGPQRPPPREPQEVGVRDRHSRRRPPRHTRA